MRMFFIWGWVFFWLTLVLPVAQPKSMQIYDSQDNLVLNIDLQFESQQLSGMEVMDEQGWLVNKGIIGQPVSGGKQNVWESFDDITFFLGKYQQSGSGGSYTLFDHFIDSDSKVATTGSYTQTGQTYKFSGQSGETHREIHEIENGILKAIHVVDPQGALLYKAVLNYQGTGIDSRRLSGKQNLLIRPRFIHGRLKLALNLSYPVSNAIVQLKGLKGELIQSWKVGRIPAGENNLVLDAQELGKTSSFLAVLTLKTGDVSLSVPLNVVGVE